MQSDRSTSPDLASWYFMKAGRLALALQSSNDPSCSPYGLLLWSPEDFVRKESTWLFHPELGLEGTMISVELGGRRYRPEIGSTTTSWIDPLSPGSGILVEWNAGGLLVRERFTGSDMQEGFRREIEVEDPQSNGERPIVVICGLYPNPLLFDGLPRVSGANEFSVYRQGNGSDHPPTFWTRLNHASGESILFERFVQVEGAVGEGAMVVVEIEYGTGTSKSSARSVPDTTFHASSDPFSGRLAIQVARSLQGISSVVDRRGRFDASIWQYGYEWGQDASVVAVALAWFGWNDLAWRVTANTLDRLVDAEGRVAESSRFRGGELAELNANGALLTAVATCTLLSGDDGPARKRIDVIARAGDLVVDAVERSTDGLITGRRDLWERLPWMGVEPGADIATNSFVLRGLLDILPFLRRIGEERRADRWERATVRLNRGMFSESGIGFVESDILIHRRLLNGKASRTMIRDSTWMDRRYRPYIPPATESGESRRSDPDSVAALPIILDLFDPASEVAGRTLDDLHEWLWNRTGTGGYLRSPLPSDPDSPGPWPFVTSWMAEAELRAGLRERAEQSTEWLLDRAGDAGSWHEYYGPRESPPFPPVGIIVWGWAQFLLLVVRGWYGITVTKDRLRITPRIDDFHHTTMISGHRIDIRVLDRYGSPEVDGTDSVVTEAGLELPLPLSGNTRVTFR